MISDSTPWKVQLLKDADLIDKWASRTKATENRSVFIEKKLFISAYAMRKLFESEKLSSKFDEINVFMQSCDPLLGKKFIKGRTFRPDEIYDVTKLNNAPLNFKRTLNLIIHSALFCEVWFGEDDERIEGFFVNSDLELSKIYFISIKRYTELMRMVGKDNVTTIKRINIHNDKAMIWRGTGEMPEHIQAKFDKAASKYNG